MDNLQRNWKPGEPNPKWPGGIPCHRNNNLEDEELGQLRGFPPGSISAGRLVGQVSGQNEAVASGNVVSNTKYSTCIKCCKKFAKEKKRNAFIKPLPESSDSDSMCGVCKKEYSEVDKAIHGTNECHTRKISKPIDVVRNVGTCPGCPTKSPEPEESVSSCAICSHPECKKSPREDLALILSVLDKNKGCDCGTVARALRTGVHEYMRIGHRFTEVPLTHGLETIDSETGDDSVAETRDNKDSKAFINAKGSVETLAGAHSKSATKSKYYSISSFKTKGSQTIVNAEDSAAKILDTEDKN